MVTLLSSLARQYINGVSSRECQAEVCSFSRIFLACCREQALYPHLSLSQAGTALEQGFVFHHLFLVAGAQPSPSVDTGTDPFPPAAAPSTELWICQTITRGSLSPPAVKGKWEKKKENNLHIYSKFCLSALEEPCLLSKTCCLALKRIDFPI